MFGMFFRGVRITWRQFRSLPKWIQWLLTVALIGLWALVIMATFGIASNTEKEAATQASATTSAAPVPTASANAVGAESTAPTVAPTQSPATRIAGLARGCLGGENPSEAAFDAQTKAALTPEGAAEFAAAYTRWLGRYPHIGDPKQQGTKLWTSDASALTRRAGEWPAGMKETSVYVSLLNGRFKVTDFTKNSAVVSLSYDVVSTTASGNQTETQSSTFTLAAVNGVWRVRDSSGVQFTPEQLEATGQPYAGGC